MNILETRFPDYEWRMIKDFRDFIVHEYFGVDERIIWDESVISAVFWLALTKMG